MVVFLPNHGMTIRTSTRQLEDNFPQASGFGLKLVRWVGARVIIGTTHDSV